MRRRTAGGLIGGLSLVLAAAAHAAAGQFAATVNGVGIPRDRLEASVNAYLAGQGRGYQFMTQPAQYKEVRRQVLDALIAQELLWQEAREKKLAASAGEVDQQLARIRESFPSPENFKSELMIGGFTEATYAEHVRRQLSVQRLIREEIAEGVTVSDEEIDDFYRANLEKMRRPEEVRVRHILIKVPPGADENADRKARERIERILAKARAGKDFAALAAAHSEDESASKGGDLGFLSREQFVPPFANAAFALTPGQISDLVRTPFGYHVIRLEERRGGDVVPQEEAAPRIREHLRSGKVSKAVEDHVERLRAAGEVRIMEPR
jgi:peptidyl-prolyl cis-trans isomerase C